MTIRGEETAPSTPRVLLVMTQADFKSNGGVNSATELAVHAAARGVRLHVLTSHDNVIASRVYVVRGTHPSLSPYRRFEVAVRLWQNECGHHPLIGHDRPVARIDRSKHGQLPVALQHRRLSIDFNRLLTGTH